MACVGVWVDPATDRACVAVAGLDWAFRRAYLPRKNTPTGRELDRVKLRGVSAMLAAGLAVRTACDVRRRQLATALAVHRIPWPSCPVPPAELLYPDA